MGIEHKRFDEQSRCSRKIHRVMNCHHVVTSGVIKFDNCAGLAKYLDLRFNLKAPFETFHSAGLAHTSKAVAY